MKRKPIKIKHHNYSLYPRKKSKGKQALTIILTILLLAALAVVGYGLGKPIMEYLRGERQPNTSEAMTAEATHETVAAESADPTVEVTVEAETVEPPVVSAKDTVFVLPTSALKTMDTLNNAIAAAKAENYTAVMVTLKSDTGLFLYNSEIDGVKGSALIAGTLSAKDICNAITSAGLVPYAKISTLKDPLSVNYIDDIRYVTADGWTWLDAAYDNGGKAWLSPFAGSTAEYVSSITAEIAAAGFKTIVLADTKYPPFRQTDYDVYLSNTPEITDPTKRVEALWSVISACDAAAKSSGAEILVMLDSADLDAADKTATSAEMANNKTKLGSVKLLINCEFDSDHYAMAKSLTGKMNAQYSGQKYSVNVATVGLDEQEKQELIKAFGEADITVFMNK